MTRSVGDLHRTAFHFLVQRTGLGEIARKVHFHALVIVTEMESQFPAAVMGAQNIGQVALDAVLPYITFKRIEELPAAFGAETNRPGEFTQNGSLHDGLGDGLQSPTMV